jgi:hypothetical protein
MAEREVLIPPEGFCQDCDKQHPAEAICTAEKACAQDWYVFNSPNKKTTNLPACK